MKNDENCKAIMKEIWAKFEKDNESSLEQAYTGPWASVHRTLGKDLVVGALCGSLRSRREAK